MHILVIGGAGFIGGHVAARYMQRGDRVTVLDNFSRRGTSENTARLKALGGDLHILQADIRTDHDRLDKHIQQADTVFHMAGQVAVTSSVRNPREDFDINALGTFNILEAMRKCGSPAPLVYPSSNKVYGKMMEIPAVERDNRYEYAELRDGVGERQPLDCYSPYGCSKGCGDLYVQDYARIYGLKTLVFRQSCIYGTHQFGIEDQGWVAWFTIAAMYGAPITIYGDGKQVRDVLYIDDLLDAFDAALGQLDTTGGQVYNIGGGPGNTLSLLELLGLLEAKLDKQIKPAFDAWRPGDQKVYVSNIAKAQRDFGWAPQTSIEAGLDRLIAWAGENKELIAGLGLFGN